MTDLSDLRSAVRGAVLMPGDESFDSARRPWNFSVEQQVLAVVEAADAEDVVALVRYARERGVTVATQPYGHAATGRTEGTILLRTGRLDELSVDAEKRTARVGAGVRSGDLVAAAAAHGLSATPGSSPIVSAVGYSLGGGVGWFARKHGIGSDHVTAFDVVDAAGERLRVTAEENADLFWALRGGGGDFAVVLAMELALHAETELFGGLMTWPRARAAQVLAAYREVTAAAPEELSVWVALVQFPGTAPMTAVALTYLGGEAEARALLRPFDLIGDTISDSRKVLAMTEFASVTADPTDPRPITGWTELLSDLDEATIEELLAAPIDPLLVVQIRHLGGVLARSGEGPHGTITEPYALYLMGITATPEQSAAVRGKQRSLVAALGDVATGRKPFTFLNPTETVAAAFPAEAVARLRQIKKDRDPAGVFQSNFPVLG
jgi:FAD/FMN-containing dehydrogenase